MRTGQAAYAPPVPIGRSLEQYEKVLAVSQDVESSQRAAPARLRGGQISPLGLAALALGTMSPAIALYALWGPIQLATGPIAPLMYVIAAVLALPAAVSYVELNKVMPSTGAASSWLWRIVSPSAGYLCGLLMATYFFMGALQQPLLFGLFFKDLLGLAGVTLSPVLSWSIAICMITLPVVWAAYRGAKASTRLAVLLMAFECVVVVALCLTVLSVRAEEPGGIHFSPFLPSTATHGAAGFWTAVVLASLAFGGFDVVSTAAEETHAPAKHIPKAIILTILVITVFWAFSSWVFTLALPDERLRAYSSAGVTAVTPMAAEFWGRGNVLIILSAFTGVAAIYVSLVLGSSRIIFAMARHGLLPAGLARVEPAHGVPHRALRLVFGMVILGNIVSLLVMRNGVDAFIWWSNALAFFMLLTFASVNLANLVFFTRIQRSAFRPLQNLVVPVIGLLLNAVVIYEAFFRALWTSPSILHRSVVWFCVGLLGVYVAAVALMRWLAPQRLQGHPPILASAEPTSGELEPTSSTGAQLLPIEEAER